MQFDNAGTFIGTLGRVGSGEGEFNFPAAIGVDGPNVFVADTDNDRIQKFASP